MQQRIIELLQDAAIAIALAMLAGVAVISPVVDSIRQIITR